MAILYLRGDAIHRLRTRLTHLDIPHRVLGEERPERSGDARCLAALLTCVLNPRDLAAVRIAAAPVHLNAGRRLSDGGLPPAAAIGCRSADRPGSSG